MPVKIHLGCGTKRLPGFKHVDMRAEVAPDYVADALDLACFGDDSADLLYFCHGLEHIRKPDVAAALAEFRRVLKPGGLLRLAVPDFEVLAQLYVNERVSLWRLGCINGRQDYRGNTHYAVYDFDYLAWHLGEAGYYDIRRWQPEHVHPLDYDDFSFAKINGWCVSLNVEATCK